MLSNGTIIVTNGSKSIIYISNPFGDNIIILGIFTGPSQCWAVLDFYEEPPILVALLFHFFNYGFDSGSGSSKKNLHFSLEIRPGYG